MEGTRMGDKEGTRKARKVINPQGERTRVQEARKSVEAREAVNIREGSHPSIRTQSAPVRIERIVK